MLLLFFFIGLIVDQHCLDFDFIITKIHMYTN